MWFYKWYKLQKLKYYENYITLNKPYWTSKAARVIFSMKSLNIPPPSIPASSTPNSFTNVTRICKWTAKGDYFVQWTATYSSNGQKHSQTQPPSITCMKASKETYRSSKIFFRQCTHLIIRIFQDTIPPYSESVSGIHRIRLVSLSSCCQLWLTNWFEQIN